MYDELRNAVPAEILRFKEPMKEHTTFRIGGPADVMVIPVDSEQVRRVVACCVDRGIPFLVMGKGSNLLVRDKGIRGVVIKLGENFQRITIRDEKIEAQAGVGLTELARKAAAEGLTGLEFAEGIPGSLGGAVYMNAGAYDGEMKDVIIGVEAIDYQGHTCTFLPPEINFGYRKSCFQSSDYIILSASLALKRGNPEEIQQKMDDYAHRRREKQPLELPSAGSIFRRPKGYYVGPMIEQMGLKGYRIGGAEISHKHAGFIVNTGDATAGDVLALIELVQGKAREQFGVELQPEIKIIGEA